MKKTSKKLIFSLLIMALTSCSNPTVENNPGTPDTGSVTNGNTGGQTGNGNNNQDQQPVINRDKVTVTTIIDGSKAANNINFMQNVRELFVTSDSKIYIMDDKTVYLGTEGKHSLDQLKDKHSSKLFSIPFTELAPESFIVKDNNIYIPHTEKAFIRLNVSGNEIASENSYNINGLDLNHVSGYTFDNSGNMYISDRIRNFIVKIDSNRNASIFAGNDITGKNEGFTNGKGQAATFNFPNKIAVDKENNLYVADTENHAIRKITPDGTVTTLAGNGKKGYKDGKGSEASFNEPYDVAVDSKGNIFVADSKNNSIRLITKDGNVTTIAGKEALGFNDGNGNTALFYDPRGIEIDKNDVLYILDSKNYKIRKLVIG